MTAYERLLRDLGAIEQDIESGGEAAQEAFWGLLGDLLSAADMPTRESRRIAAAVRRYIEKQREAQR